MGQTFTGYFAPIVRNSFHANGKGVGKDILGSSAVFISYLLQLKKAVARCHEELSYVVKRYLL